MTARYAVQQSQMASTLSQQNQMAYGLRTDNPQASIDFNGFFGIEAYVCDICFAMKCRLFYENPREQDGIAIQTPPCTGSAPDLPSRNGMTPQQYIKTRSQDFPEFLKKCVMDLTENVPYLTAIALDYSSLTKNGVNITTLRKGKDLNIILPYSEDRCFKLHGLPSWASNSIKFKHTLLIEEELDEFLGITGNATFAFFRIPHETLGSGIYFMAIEKYSIQDLLREMLDSIDPTTVDRKTVEYHSPNPSSPIGQVSSDEHRKTLVTP